MKQPFPVRWVWAPDSPPTRNQHVGFVNSFVWEGGEFWFHLFADTRYRLFVNGQRVGDGPARFVTQHPEYDSYDLQPYLQTGKNEIWVDVNFYGCSSYQSMRDGRPGFIAWSKFPDFSLSTPGTWTCRPYTAWRSDTAAFSFAQNPLEVLDTRILEKEKTYVPTTPVQVLEPEQIVWNFPRPRSVPMPSGEPLRPSRINGYGAVKSGQTRIGFQCCRAERERCWQRFCTWIWSPKAQEISLLSLWVDIELNGTLLGWTDTHLGNQQSAAASFQEGWNFISGTLNLLTDPWGFLIGWPTESGLEAHAHRDRACEIKFLLSSPETESRAPLAVEESTEGWYEHSGDPLQVPPARLTAWDEPAQLGEHPVTDPVEACYTSYSFSEQFFGSVVLDVETPEGTILDVSYDDWLRQDGMTNLYNSNPFINATDRFILRGGRQRIETLNPRGGLHLQVLFRASGNEKKLFPTLGKGVVHDVHVALRRCLPPAQARFKSGDQVLDKAFALGCETLVVSTDDSYTDCPWRERGTYLGDSFVNLWLHGLVTSDYAIAARVIRLFAQAQNDQGLFPGVVPAWHETPMLDFSLLWAQLLHDYWAFTGDVELVSEMWPVLTRLWDSPVWQRTGSGLWDAKATAINTFIDWGVVKSDRTGTGNSLVNILCVAGLRASADLAKILGEEEHAIRYEEEAEVLVSALMQSLWLEDEGRFAASLDDSKGLALHANVLALRYGIGPSDRLLAYMEPLIKNNFIQGLGEKHTGFLELYFFHFALPALADAGRPDLAEELILEHHGFLQSLGGPSLPECFSRADQGMGSHCHSWSGAPAWYAIRYVLGLRQVQPGNRKLWRVRPCHSPRFQQVSGSIPHPYGDIQVSWVHNSDGMYTCEVSAPEGVTVQLPTT